MTFLPFLLAFFSCGEKVNYDELITGRWAVTGNDCDREGRCRELYKFMGGDFYRHNEKSMVMEFRPGGGMSQPILGEGMYRFKDGSLSIGINAAGEQVWNESEAVFLSRDEIVIRFKKTWRKYKRID